MSEIHSKEDLQYIVENLIDELRECEDGTTFDTFHLLERAGYDGSEFDHDDLYDIHFTLFRKAKENHITLDMSAHDRISLNDNGISRYTEKYNILLGWI